MGISGRGKARTYGIFLGTHVVVIDGDINNFGEKFPVLPEGWGRGWMMYPYPALILHGSPFVRAPLSRYNAPRACRT